MPLLHLIGGVESHSQAIIPDALTLQPPLEVGISWPFAAKVTSKIISSEVKENRTIVLLRCSTKVYKTI